MKMNKTIYYTKSLEEDFATKTLRGKKKVSFQTLDDMIKRGVIKPNTKSFGRQKRLSTTILSPQYTKTYRPQGIIFQTDDKPEYIAPFDLVLLTDADKIVVHYYRIKNDLHIYYNHELMPGFEKFIFKSFTAMLSKISSPARAWKAVNDFRVLNGYKKLPRPKHRLVEYNEAVFEKSVHIQPVAIFGYRKKAREMAKKYGLPYFSTARKFYESISK